MLADSGAYTIIQSLIAAGSGLLGVCVGGHFAARQQRQERRNTRVREQLQEFYSPMVGMRYEIFSKTEVRSKLRSIAQTVRSKQFEGVTDLDEKRRIQREMRPDYVEFQMYNETQFLEHTLPTYQKMLEHFSTHMWLAEPSTRAFYKPLCDFVEIWQRCVGGTIPPEVQAELSLSEAPLEPFYTDLRHHFDRLRAELSR